jgi:2-iminobutanoate/2-iminopropanoate deaminase
MAAVGNLARQAIASRVLPTPRFLYTPVIQAGGFVFVSGMVAIDPNTNVFAGGNAAHQTTCILNNLQRLLTEQGWVRSQIVLARIFCTNFAAFPDINQAWDAFFEGETPPARTSVGASALPLGAEVEIEFQLLPAPAHSTPISDTE